MLASDPEMSSSDQSELRKGLWPALECLVSTHFSMNSSQLVLGSPNLEFAAFPRCQMTF